MVKDNKNTQVQTDALVLTKDPVFENFKTSVIIVSLFANLTVFVTWLTTIV